MEIKHCGKVLEPTRERVLKPTADEASRGVLDLQVREYFCSTRNCKKRLFYQREVTRAQVGEWQRVRPHRQAEIKRRIRLAKQSDWVWGYSPQTFSKIKVNVE